MPAGSDCRRVIFKEMIVFCKADKSDKTVTVYLCHQLCLDLAYPIMTLSGRGLEYFIQELIGAVKYLNEPDGADEIVDFVNTLDDIDKI